MPLILIAPDQYLHQFMIRPSHSMELEMRRRKLVLREHTMYSLRKRWVTPLINQFLHTGIMCPKWILWLATHNSFNIQHSRIVGVLKSKENFLTQNTILKYIFLFHDTLYITEGYWRFKSHVSGCKLRGFWWHFQTRPHYSAPVSELKKRNLQLKTTPVLSPDFPVIFSSRFSDCKSGATNSPWFEVWALWIVMLLSFPSSQIGFGHSVTSNHSYNLWCGPNDFSNLADITSSCLWSTKSLYNWVFIYIIHMTGIRHD